MPSPLITAMLEKHRYPVLDKDNLSEFLQNNAEVVLFFAENPKQYPESNDVAMILPELVKAFQGRFQAALVSAAFERTLQKQYGFDTWPALVFLRNGQYLGTISKVQNWEDYLRMIERILDSEPARAPGIGIAVETASGSACH
ncbi:MAG TPA: hydrogenase [Chromatiaceae bacterium]|nr:hydrogenase [Chromatiaceae bacterium]